MRGTIAYTTSWSVRRAAGNKVSIWDVSGNVPMLIDSLIINGASTTGDVAVSDDGRLLVVATERVRGSIVDLRSHQSAKADAALRLLERGNQPRACTPPRSVESTESSTPFLRSIRLGATLARLVTVDLTNPAAPTEVFTKVIGRPYVHDTFARDGLLFLALWDDGVEIWDIGGCGTGAIAGRAQGAGLGEDVGRPGPQHLVVPRRERFEAVRVRRPGGVRNGSERVVRRHPRHRPQRSGEPQGGRVLHGAGRRDPQFLGG